MVYFSNDKKSWLVRDFIGREWELKVNSPLKEKDCFVFFDESRCRGADMKLLPNAVGLLTLGP